MHLTILLQYLHIAGIPLATVHVCKCTEWLLFYTFRFSRLGSAIGNSKRKCFIFVDLFFYTHFDSLCSAGVNN